MYRLSSIIFLILFGVGISLGQSPHGKAFTMDCASCHNSEGWTYDKKNSTFDHDKTDFPLFGQHKSLECKSCHNSLEFNKAETDCISCHTDMHQQTVGTDCARCHTPESWIVSNITELHERTSFPLKGVHATVDCNQCHQSETLIRFSPTGLECIDCHRSDYLATTIPNHSKAGFSDDCASCHSTLTPDWVTDKVDHSFFPLTKSHAIDDCTACHKGSTYSDISSQCISCHEQDYNGTLNPKHSAAGFSINCNECHTTDPGWTPVSFNLHDAQYFPIYSGKHNGVWTECIECHKDPNNFASNTCITCHKNPETDNAHNGVSGYIYNDAACLACHPTGDAGVSFDHNATAFPLTGAHAGLECLECHAGGFQGTSTSCVDCHTNDFNATTNPNHNAIGISTDCASCHTTAPGWEPATFNIHNQYYPLNGAHALISNDCAACHNGDYNNTPNTCIGCHQSDYIATTNPNHLSSNFSNDCASCHSETAWQPSNINHDGSYFPIYSGKHQGVWNECVECHNIPGNFAQFTCVTCHANPETNDVHNGVSGYVYNSDACLGCHPTGDADMPFDHNATSFPLTGGHNGLDCIQCHTGGFQGTSTACIDCHMNDFNATINPNHNNLGLGTDCASCHTTIPGWEPASFAVHNTFYPLNGAHALISSECVTCHNGNYNLTPNTCIGCHNADYVATTNPNHTSSNFPTDCASCHSESAWEPSTFNHDGLYFPIHSGKHLGTWDNCVQCHTNSSDFSQFTCTTCHANPETDNGHGGVSGYVYNSNACLACHPTGDADMPFDHNATDFPLTGGHLGLDCLQCHSGGFQGTSTACVDCHTNDYNGASNPNHTSLGLSQDCATCHTTAPGWAPATFVDHSSIYPLNGAHALIAQECASCHNGNYNTTPNTCVGCHQSDFNGTTNPNHSSSQFSTTCVNCHSETSWSPSNFDHNNVYPLTGAHAAIATNCAVCHNGNYNNTPNTCFGCHNDDYAATTNPNHAANQFSNNCVECHTNNAWTPATFDHNSVYPFTGAHIAISNNCVACHVNGNYNNTPNTCAGCHIDDYNGTTNPNHAVNQFSNNCVECHTNNAWTPSTFDHNSVYPFTGAHIAIANNCVACHINGNYNNTPNTCAGCHIDDYNGTTNPNHAVNQFSNNCVECHTNNAWTPSTFDHNSIYPFTGAHIAIANNCVACHVNGNYNNTPNTCAGCHIDDYNGTTNPNHAVNQFSNNCVECHTNNAWTPSTFDHNSVYPFGGAHIAIANNCVACHVNGNYNNTPNTCIGCHQQDYNNANNPNHQNAQFPTDCTQCHSQTAWEPSTFDHDNMYFPIYSGKHKDEWNQCSECHTTPGNFAIFNCIGCHNNQGQLQNQHQDVNNYQYNSNACFACHPDGEN